MSKKTKWAPPWRPEISPRTLVLAVLGAITVGVAALSVSVSYGIIVPRFGEWAVPTVVALDALWVVAQATEVLARANRERAKRPQYAGLVLTAVIAAIPTFDLAMTLTRTGEPFDLAVVLAPMAIVLTKLAWWIVLPALGRQTSADTRATIETRRQEVADQLEEMEAEAAHRIELMRVATNLQQRVTEAETSFRLSALAAQQQVTEQLHAQAETTSKTLTEMPLPALVGQIALPELTGWAPSAPALPVTPAVTAVMQVSSLMGPQDVTPRVTPVTLEELSAVANVPVPDPDSERPLTDAQLEVVLRHQRHRTDPPSSYRQSALALRRAGFSASERRVRQTWRALMKQEGVEDPEMDGADDDADADGVR